MTTQEAGELLLGTFGEKDEDVALALGVPAARLESDLVDSGIVKCPKCRIWLADSATDGFGYCADCSTKSENP